MNNHGRVHFAEVVIVAIVVGLLSFVTTAVYLEYQEQQESVERCPGARFVR